MAPSLLINIFSYYEEAILFNYLCHQGWYLHDAYWLGACIFIVHLLLLRPAFMHNRNVISRLVIMTTFWPMTYIVFTFCIVRMRILKLKSIK
jgi:hypothetical protein